MSFTRYINRFRHTYNLLYHQTGLGFPPGHYYSPVVNKNELAHRDELFDNFPRQLPDINLREASQMLLLGHFSKLYPSIPFTKEQHPERRYNYDAPGNQYCYSDAIMLHCIMRTFEPRRIIEVGSGFSSAVMLDTNQQFFGNRIQFTFIEPYPQRLYGLMKDGDQKRAITHEKGLQEINLAIFDQLGENDILFIDSTHVSKVGSDVNQVIFRILPRLKKGVLIHFHDIFYPFEYPKDWIMGSNGLVGMSPIFYGLFLQIILNMKLLCLIRLWNIFTRSGFKNICHYAWKIWVVVYGYGNFSL